MGPVAEQMVPLNCPPGLEYLTLIGTEVLTFRTRGTFVSKVFKIRNK